MSDSIEERMDRYVRGDLTPEEARELAQKSLADPELFEDLTASSLARASAVAPPGKVVRFPRRVRFVVAGAVAAAVVMSIPVYLLRPSRPGSQVTPALAVSAKPGQPILLASGLPTEPNSAPVFRSAEAESRAPRADGSIVSLEDGEAAVNIGSLDGLAKGGRVEIFRDEKSIGNATVTTVFRERARIGIGPGVRIGDRVRGTSGSYFDALLQQVDARWRRGDSDGARKISEKAAELAEAAPISLRDLERLATLEYQLGLLQAAEKHYQSAEREASFGSLNNLAVLHMLRGDYDGAEALLRRVISTSPKTEVAYARSLNNLGVLAELRGDKRGAEAHYADALRAAADATTEERHSLEVNLARIRGVR